MGIGAAAAAFACLTSVERCEGFVVDDTVGVVRILDAPTMDDVPAIRLQLGQAVAAKAAHEILMSPVSSERNRPSRKRTL